MKAFLFNTRNAIAREIAGKEAFEAAVARMDAKTRELVWQPRPAHEWVAVERNHDFLKWMLEVGYGGEMAKVVEQGRRTQKAGAKTVYKIFLRFFEPSHIIERGPAYYQLAYRENGSLSVQVMDPSRVLVKYKDVALPSAPFYEHQRGGLIALGQLTGSKETSAVCMEGGGDAAHCTIDLRFKI